MRIAEKASYGQGEEALAAYDGNVTRADLEGGFSFLACAAVSFVVAKELITTSGTKNREAALRTVFSC